MNYRLVVIGASRGGLNAVKEILGPLAPDFLLPVVVVLHRAEDSSGLAVALQNVSALPSVEAEDKAILEPGKVYLAPANYHLLVDEAGLALSIDGPVHHARPAIDALFESAAEIYGHRVIGIILTGSSADGARGLAAIKKAGGLTIIQDPQTAEDGAMPAAALAAVPAVDQVLPLERIGDFLTKLLEAR